MKNNLAAKPFTTIARASIGNYEVEPKTEGSDGYVRTALSNEETEFWGVYFRDPETSLAMWVADFATFKRAWAYAKSMA